MGNQITPIKSSTPVAERAADLITTTNVSRAVIEAVVDLSIAFPAGRPSENAVVARTQQLVVKAVSGVPEWLGQLVLKSFIWKNPRNPFAPTPQDIRERCEVAQSLLHRRVDNFYLGNLGWYYVTQKNSEIDLGPPPGDRRAFIPESVVIHTLRRVIEERSDNFFDEMTEEKFNAIPIAAFPDGKRERVVASRQACCAERQRETASRRWQGEIRERYGKEVYDAWWELWLMREDKFNVSEELATKLVELAAERVREKKSKRLELEREEAEFLRIGRRRA